MTKFQFNHFVRLGAAFKKLEGGAIRVKLPSWRYAMLLFCNEEVISMAVIVCNSKSGVQS